MTLVQFSVPIYCYCVILSIIILKFIILQLALILVEWLPNLKMRASSVFVC
jgi:hypothetical protein